MFDLPVEASADVPPKPLVVMPHLMSSYTVNAGDTLIQIALDTGHSPTEIARWNGLSDPGKIVVGQVLRLVPPAPDEMPLVNGQPTTTTISRPVTSDEDLKWTWPAAGPLLVGFSQSKKKGIEMGGVAGDAVLAAADGRVIYAGSSLRTFGNAIILKHNNTYVTLYGHTQSVMVKEDQVVKRGQKIAELDSSKPDSIKLHFEVRKSGNPIDPILHLPTR